jgi:hypothetical protein
MYAIAANYSVGEFRLAMRYRRLPGRNSDLRLLATHGRDASVLCNAMTRALRRRSIHLIQGGHWTDPLYPMAAARGPAPPEGLVFDVAGDCVRREPSREIDRLQPWFYWKGNVGLDGIL